MGVSAPNSAWIPDWNLEWKPMIKWLVKGVQNEEETYKIGKSLQNLVLNFYGGIYSLSISYEKNKTCPAAIKHTLHTTWVTSKPDLDIFPTVLNLRWHQWPLSHATSMVLNKTYFQKGQTFDYTISTFYICTGPILWVKGSMTGMKRAHKRPSPFRPWAHRLRNSQMLAGPLPRMDTTTWVNSNTRRPWGFTSDHGKTTAGPRGQMTSTNVARRLTAHEVGASSCTHFY